MKRRSFLKVLGISSLGTLGSWQILMNNSNTQITMPVLFVGHGAPLYTLGENEYSLAWQKIAQSMPKPNAIICISAHWLTKGTQVTAMQNPRTIHDFGRMDDRLFEMQYKAQGNPELASELIKEIQKTHIAEDHTWGFDHGTWTVLRWMYPEADIPVIQLSLDYKKDMQYHYDLAK